MNPVATSLVDILRWRATHQPHRLAYRFLADGEFDEATFNYEDLDRRARAIGALLQPVTKPGDRALILFPPGLDFIAAYFGCQYARVIAIPAYPPHPLRIEKTLPIVLGIAADARPSAVLLTSSLFDGIMSRKDISAEFGTMKLLVTDTDEINNWADQWQQPAISGEDIAFLQYTSGSTTTPKGVMVSHSNLMHNLGHIEKSFGQSSESQGAIWLPPYHDMGLIGGILHPLCSGYPVTVMPYMMFLQRPFRWLQAISRFRITGTGGPNFAYDLCVRKIKPEQRDQLDLSCWEVAFNGAEQVYHKTLEEFAAYFAPCGFRREAFLPCYGLAEGTLLVTGGPKLRLPVIRHLLSKGLEQNKVIISETSNAETRTLVSSGQNLSEQQIKIVDTETLMPCPADQIGEIWLSGPSVAKGYWNKPEVTQLTFGARLSVTGEGPFMRTGDLGFLLEGELYVTGRLKDLIICDGHNHYPNDIEKTVESSHPVIRPSGSAAFSINTEEGERVIIIVEIENKTDGEATEIIKAIRNAVSLHHELHVSDIRLTKPGGIPRTHSGKIKHYLCKNNYIAGDYNEIPTI